MRILITGVSGLLGLNIAFEVSKDHHVFGVVHEHPVLTKDFQILQTDLTEKGAVDFVFERSQPDAVVHCAAITDVDHCQKEPDLAKEINAYLPGKIADRARKYGAKMIHVSTDAVFNGQEGNYAEGDEPHPVNVYGATKLRGEKEVAQIDPQAIIARVNFFGWSLSGNRSLAEFFLRNLRKGKDILGFKDAVFTPLLANDLGKILLELLSQDFSGLIHVGSQDKMSKYEFGLEIARRFNYDSDLIRPGKVQEAGLNARRGLDLSMNVERLQETLGFDIPELSTELDRFYTLYQQDYPQKLKNMSP